MKMRVPLLFFIVLFLLHQSTATNGTAFPIYIVTVTSQAVGESMERMCVQLFQPREPLSMRVLLKWESQNKTLLEENSLTQDFYRCIPFQVPHVNDDCEATIEVIISGESTLLKKTSKILIKPSSKITIIYTDKPIYKPGQTVKLRIISLDSSFLTRNEVFHTVEIKDPVHNRIAQWLNQSTVDGILDLSYSTSSEAAQGNYTISVWGERMEKLSTQDFEIKEYVLPKYEITLQLPQFLTIVESFFDLEVCAKYTYGKPVMGNVKVKIVRNKEPALHHQKSDIIRDYEMTTRKTGCASLHVNSEDFAFNKRGHIDILHITSEVEEYGTGVILSNKGEISLTDVLVQLTFVDAPHIYKPGHSYEGKIKAIGPGSTPVKNDNLQLLVLLNNQILERQTLTTDNNGIAYFSMNTTLWKLSAVTLRAFYKENKSSAGRIRQALYNDCSMNVKPSYSKSRSFLKLKQIHGKFDCDKEASVGAKYIIKGSELKKEQQSLDFFYMVMSRGSLHLHGRWSVAMNSETENKGELSISLPQLHSLAPVAQVVVYSLLPGGEVVADKLDFPIQKCFINKVSLNFSSLTELPGARTLLSLKAHPGSLCSVRAIDQSVLLLKPENELNTNSVFDLLPVQKLSGYPPQVDDSENYPCFQFPEDQTDVQNPVNEYNYFGPSDDRVDAYSVFKDVGIKILTNSDVKRPIDCRETNLYYYEWESLDSVSYLEGDFDMASLSDTREERKALIFEEPTKTIRKFFPETWIWDLIKIGHSGSMDIQKTVPDTITKWSAGAFCTSPVGFGIAPSIGLTAFQPFFVSLTLPYSVIFGEVFALKATVFNYLPSCIMVKVTLEDSKQFSSQPCKGCLYTHCLCSDENRTFKWMITPSALGKVSIEVSAEALQTEVLCGNEVVTVPERGRIDTVLRKLIVEPEGTKESKSHNELICLSGGSVEKNVSLTLPDVFVQGSPKAFVSVLGDLMGRALNNVDRLLAMPYGCGEQNMIRFAPNIFILQYLEGSHQLTSEIKTKAIPFLESGYQRELNYKHNDGSYSAFGTVDTSGNTWLTAFVMKCFGSAKQYIFIEQQYIDQAKAWLSHLQKKNGCFTSVGKLLNSDLKGGISDEMSLSAYIVAALLEIGIGKTDPVVRRGLSCIGAPSNQLDNIYVTALLSYTFTLAGNKEMRDKLLSHLDKQAKVTGDGRHWQTGQGRVDSLDVETTSYVLLALLSGPNVPDYGIAYSRSIVAWLVKQQNEYGGFFSTQDTVVALQALAKYSAATYSSEIENAITVTSPSDLKSEFTITQDNRLLYQESRLQEVPGNYHLEAKGKGCFLMQFTLTYHIPPSARYPAFTISASTVGKCTSSSKTVELSVHVRYNGMRKETNMAIINIKLLSGFELEEPSLKHIKNDPSVKRVDQEDGHIIIYLDELKKHENKTYSLEIREEIPVHNLKPAVVKVYDYYQTADEAVAEYSSPCAQSDDLNEI